MGSGRTTPQAPPRPPFWAASIAVHVAAAVALVVWGGAATTAEPLSLPEIAADVDYTDDVEEVQEEPLEEPDAPPTRATFSPFEEPSRPEDDLDDYEMERPQDYVLPRIPVPPLSWCREAIVRPLPDRATDEPVPTETAPRQAREPAPPAPRPAGVTVAARPDANRSPAPKYPARARRRGLEGRVVLIVEIDARGRPTAVTVSKGSGHSILDRAATEALWKWRFVPAMEDGVPVASKRHQSFRFALR